MQERLPWFLDTEPSAACAKGGKGAYTDSIQTLRGRPDAVVGLPNGSVTASAFRSNYVPLSSQADFIAGLGVGPLSPLRSPRAMQYTCEVCLSIWLQMHPALLSGRDDDRAWGELTHMTS